MGPFLLFLHESPYLIVFLRNWIETEGYDVAAMAKNAPSPTQFQMMLRTLLEDRFKLKTHRETKEIPVYWLVVAKGGPKLRDVKEEEAFNRDPHFD